MTDPVDLARLIDEAEHVAASAYAPYSGFRVGAVVVASDGREFVGVNVENAAFGSTVCAETNAICSAAAAGARLLPVVAVASPDGHAVFPCGNCRQMMNEFGVEIVAIREADGTVAEYRLDHLLPRAFGPDDLPDAPAGER